MLFVHTVNFELPTAGWQLLSLPIKKARQKGRISGQTAQAAGWKKQDMQDLIAKNGNKILQKYCIANGGIVY